MIKVDAHKPDYCKIDNKIVKTIKVDDHPVVEEVSALPFAEAFNYTGTTSGNSVTIYGNQSINCLNYNILEKESFKIHMDASLMNDKSKASVYIMFLNKSGGTDVECRIYPRFAQSNDLVANIDVTGNNLNSDDFTIGSAGTGVYIGGSQARKYGTLTFYVENNTLKLHIDGNVVGNIRTDYNLASIQNVLYIKIFANQYSSDSGASSSYRRTITINAQEPNKYIKGYRNPLIEGRG